MKKITAIMISGITALSMACSAGAATADTYAYDASEGTIKMVMGKVTEIDGDTIKVNLAETPEMPNVELAELSADGETYAELSEGEIFKGIKFKGKMNVLTEEELAELPELPEGETGKFYLKFKNGSRELEEGETLPEKIEIDMSELEEGVKIARPEGGSKEITFSDEILELTIDDNVSIYLGRSEDGTQNTGTISDISESSIVSLIFEVNDDGEETLTGISVRHGAYVDAIEEEE